VPASQVARPTALTTWLQQNGPDTPFASTENSLFVPDTATLYGLHDVRTYDVIRSGRSRQFWSGADPGYHDEGTYTILAAPRVDWLATAGVGYVLTPVGHELAGTTPVFEADQVTVARVPGSRPFAWAAPSWSSAPGSAQARAGLLSDP